MKNSYFLLAILISSSIISYAYPKEKVFPWKYTPIDKVPKNQEGELIIYGKNLVTETYKYIGPLVKDKKMRFAGNNLSCKNCHLDSGTKKYSGGFVGVYQRYPQFRARNNSMQSLEGRINDCMERSLNGKVLDINSKEMKAFISYMKWLSKDIPKEYKKVEGQGFVKINLLDRAASPVNGRKIYMEKCMSCHGINGQGLQNGSKLNGYIFPPLWGNDSFNTGAGMYRIITAASFIKANMPFGNPNLTDEEAFDVAAYINSQPRPSKKGLEKDYPNLKLKPVDTPYPPYADNFSQEQHKYGPFKEMIKE
jgi:thiosulfate dehydrogenase